MIRLVHGNVCSVQKLVKEFIYYWSNRNSETPSSCQTESPTSASNEETPMDVSSKSDQAVSSPLVSTSPTSSNNKCAISKRQLDIKIRSIAVYEKRDFKRVCWHVNEKVLEEYKLTDLPVPTEWKWLTRPNNTPKSGRETPTSKSGVVTPSSTPTSISNLPSITQFTVAVDPSELLLHAPISTKPAPPLKQTMPDVISSSVPSTPSSQDKINTKETPKRQKISQHVNPLTLFKNMKPPTKTAAPGLSNGNPVLNSNNKNNPIVLDEDSGDCMIVENSPEKLPEKVPKNQPTLLAMFKKK